MQPISPKERTQAVVFLVVGLLSIALVCGLLVGLPLLKGKRQYFVRFHESVAGLEQGTAVRYWGVKKGRVRDIRIDNEHGVIQAELELDTDLLVTETTMAKMSSTGILGPYFIELSGTVKGSPELAEGAVIGTDLSTMRTLVEKGTSTVEHLEVVLKNLEGWTNADNQAKFTTMLDEAAAALATANRTMTALSPETERMFRSYADAGEELEKLLQEVRPALMTFLEQSNDVAREVKQFLASGRLDQVAMESSRTLESIRNDFHQASESFTRFISDTRIDERLSSVVASLERTEQSISRLSDVIQGEVVSVARGELRQALANFRDAMGTFEELARVLRNDPSLVIFSRPRPEVDIPRPGAGNR